MKILVLYVLFVASITYVSCVKQNAVSPSNAVKLTEFLDDITEFFTDVLYSISTMIGLEKQKTINLSSELTYKDVLKYTLGTIISGYKMIKKTIPVLKMTRDSVESVSMVLPNVTLAKFVEHIVNNITPELIKSR